MPRPRLYEKNSDRHKAFRARKKAAVETVATVADETQELVRIAEQRGFIAVGDVPILEKVRALRAFLTEAQEAQLRISEGCR